MIEVDVLVIGAGPSGCVSASILHKNGLKVRIVEKEAFPRFVIGESLLPRCMEALAEADLLDAVKAKGFQEKFGAKFVRGNQVCDFNFADQSAEGFSWTWQVPRAEFDQTLANELQNRGVPIDFRHSVEAIQFFPEYSLTEVLRPDGEKETIKARFIIDSSGYGRVIPKLLNLDRPSDQPSRQTFFAHLTDAKRLEFSEPNRITIVSVQPGVWVWMIPFSNGNTSVGFVGDQAFFSQFTGDPAQVLRSLISHEKNVAMRFADQDFVLSPRKLEGWSVTTEKFYGDGFVLTGNVTEFLDPMFSSGVTLAVVSGARAANIVVNQLRGIPVDWEEDYMKPTMKGVDVFRSFVKSWYDGTLPTIFFGPTLEHHFKNQICSVLAGYVWDEMNPFVSKREKALRSLADFIRLQESEPV
ncbi:MAG: NAD(P)/FAD-dependent oxidoreductase [Proteobacteria bacterium]|nr:MAG: NAD(P)/FAD-dependent oxidoreductase [Pseudomonadota bacterium]